MEIVFVGQCEVFVGLGFGHFFFCFFFPLAAKLIGTRTGRQFFKNVDFLDLHPLKGEGDGLKIVFVGQCEVFVCL